MPDESAVTVRMPSWILWLLGIGCGVLGCVLGLLIKPLVHWLVDLIGSAPGPLRLAAELPGVWPIIALTVIGLLAGAYLAHEAHQEALQVTVSAESVLLVQHGDARDLHAASISQVFLDGKELVLLDKQAKQLARRKADDLPREQLRDAFERFDYQWAGTADPHEPEFVRWTDGDPELDDNTHRLLRSRARALTDNRAGEAEDAAEQLQDRGIVVRDRDDGQQVRRV